MKSTSKMTFCSFIADNYYYRHQLQKIEFCACWVMLFTTAYLQAWSPLSTFYMKASTITRAIAYIFDFSNAYLKNKGGLPSWLVLHHGGVFLHHLTFSISINQDVQGIPFRIMICFFLASQSSHNTWTKKISMTCYWGNVLVGVLTCSYIQHLCCVHLKSYVATCVMGGSLFATLTGVSLLFLKSVGKMNTSSICVRRRKIHEDLPIQ